MIPTLRKFRGGQSKQIWGGGQSRGEAQLKKNTLYAAAKEILICIALSEVNFLKIHVIDRNHN